MLMPAAFMLPILVLLDGQLVGIGAMHAMMCLALIRTWCCLGTLLLRRFVVSWNLDQNVLFDIVELDARLHPFRHHDVRGLDA